MKAIKMRALMILVLAMAMTQASWSQQPVKQKDFASPDEAVQSLITALRSDNKQAMLETLGAASESAIDSGDPVQDKNTRERFLKSYDVTHALANLGVKRVLEVGSDKWPFPFPLVQKNARWSFDSAAGVEEIVNRRVGGNELSAIQSCLAFVDAEREYYIRNPQRDALQHYAQKLISTEGKRDGLYWTTKVGEPLSPLGEEFARARGEGYLQTSNPKAEPYHGYMFQLLAKQGSHAKGGAYEYFVAGKMMGGFALVAFPADYGNSGVMTFIVNHDGVVFSKDLGTDTPKLALAMTSFDPDSTWKREAVIE